MSHVTHRKDSCHTYEWVMSLVRMSHVTDINEPCHTWEWVMSQTRVSHGTNTNGSCQTDGWVKWHTWIGHMTDMDVAHHKGGGWGTWSSTNVLKACGGVSGERYLDESCQTWESVLSHIGMSYVIYEWVLSHICKPTVTFLEKGICMSHVTRVSEWCHKREHECQGVCTCS